VFGFIFAGPLFIAYANLNLDAPAALFVLERFFLFSHVLVAPLVCFGSLLVADIVTRVTRKAKGSSITLAVCVSVVVIAALFPRYKEIDQRGNHLARDFAKDIFATVEPNSILLTGGDEVVLPLQYLQAAEGYRLDVTLIIIPLLAGDWYVRQLRERNPGLALPFTRLDGKAATTRTLVEANPGRPIVVVGDLTDKSLEGLYWFYQRGLVSVMEPMSKDIMLSQMAAENEKLLSSYKLPSPDRVKWKTFEAGIIARYATPAYKVAQEYDKGRRFEEARHWYQRALEIDPQMQLASEGLGKLAQHQ
jgi:tetratricopeptide (TPR) repeat protein